MKENKSLLDKAFVNLSAAKALLLQNTKEEPYCNIIAFLLQQAVELSIKYQLEQAGARCPNGCDITELLQWATEHNIKLFVTDYVYDRSEMFSAWESKTRYTPDYKVELRRIEQALPEVERILKICRENCIPFVGKNEHLTE